MQADIEKFDSGWCGLSLGVKETEIDQLISALQDLKKSQALRTRKMLSTV